MTSQYSYDDERNDDDDYLEYDDMESSLLGETDPINGSSSSTGRYTIPQLEKKMNLTSKVNNEIIQSEKKGEKRANYYGRDDRATSEQVLDPRTRMILFKLLSSHFLLEINGCLSTGKEANVYYAKGENNLEYAVKIFKTSILVFKDRDRF
jgi:RIO kinase 1